MVDRVFRFGVVATPRGGGAQWRAQAGRYAELGYTSLLMPDGTQLPAPFPSLAVAATAADLTVGTFVAAAPLRTPGLAAWEAHSMTVLTDGRFEFGIGAGRPGVEQQAAQLGMPFGSPGERLALVAATLDAVRELDDDHVRTTVLMACGGPRSRALAAERADIVTFATDALAPRETLRDLVADVRRRAGERADAIEFATNLFVVGTDVPPHVFRYLDVSREQFLAADTVARVSGSSEEMADELTRRRTDFGTSYVTVNAEFSEQFAPVVALLAGK